MKHFAFALVFFLLSMVAYNQEKRVLDTFGAKGVDLKISADVTIVQGKTNTCEVVADKDIIDEIISELDGEVLEIKYKSNFNRINKKATIRLVLSEFKEISVSGSGKIISENNISTSSLKLSISGSGDIILADLDVNDINSKISGSGDVKIKGSKTVEKLNCSISGSGDWSSEELKVNNVSIKISGSGNAIVFADKTLDARVSGSGDIEYKGNGLVDASVSGSGKIKRISE